MGFHDLFNLGLVLIFHCLYDCIGVAVSLFLIVITTLLELLQSQLKLALGLYQITLVVVFLGLKEHDFAFPKSLVTIVVALEILQLALGLL